jgi:hypothetical protein
LFGVPIDGAAPDQAAQKDQPLCGATFNTTPLQNKCFAVGGEFTGGFVGELGLGQGKSALENDITQLEDVIVSHTCFLPGARTL